MKKKIYGIVLGLAMTFVINGCGNPENNIVPTPAETPVESVAPTQELTQKPIEIVAPTETPESTATPTPEPTSTPTPEPTATPTPEPTAIPTPKPTATPTPTPEPTPTPTEIPHEHVYTESITKEAICTEAGEKTFTCDCGNSYTESIKAPGHHYGEYVYNNDATQEKDGTKSRTCVVCGKKDTKTAEGTKLPFDPYSLRAVTSLDDIFDAGTMTYEDVSILSQIGNNISEGKYEKIRYIASNGEQFCLWNVRVKDARIDESYYYWFIAPVEGKFSDGEKSAKFGGFGSEDGDSFIIARGMNTSSRENECMLNRDESIPLAYRKIDSKECPVTLYEIVETENMVSVWVESTNCIQEGIGTCGSINCTGTCLRQTTLNQLRDLTVSKGMFLWISGENGRINWNGKLLVNYFYLERQ